MMQTKPSEHSTTSSVTGREPKYYDIVGALFVAVYLISQVSSTKLIALGPLVLPGAIIIFPIAYIFGDILTEVYGYARTRRIIWIALFAAILFSAVLLIVEIMPAPPFWTHQQAYQDILGFVPRIVAGSILAFWAGEFVNSYVLAKMKLWTKGRFLWTRTIGSTIVGQAVDSIVFASVAFAGTVPIDALFNIVGSLYLVKVLYEAVATPITYAVVGFLKRAEGIDVYDHKTNFTPFRF